MGEGVQTSALGRASEIVFSMPMLAAGLGADMYAGHQYEKAAEMFNSTARGRKYLNSYIQSNLNKDTSNYLFTRMGRRLPFGSSLLSDIPTARFKAAREKALAQIGSNKKLQVKAMGLLREASQIKAITRMTMLFGTAATLYDVGKSVGNYFSSKGRETINKVQGMGSNPFYDSNMAYTTRQRALRAIQNGQSGHRRALGSEANYLHEYN